MVILLNHCNLRGATPKKAWNCYNLTMQATQYSNINELLDLLLFRIQKVLGKKLVGLYLYGSLATGDFDPNVSDIDLLAALESEVDDKEFEQLEKMHLEFTDEHKEWNDRIEVQYMSVLALKTFKTKDSKAAVISPGELFHIKKVGKHWLMNWYIVREKGVILFGPDPRTIIEPVSKEEFIESVKDHAKSWDKWVQNMHSQWAQAYAILTLCRALYTVKNGEQVSKKQAALWTEKELPEWISVIQHALIWSKDRQNKQVKNEEIFSDTVKFVNDIIKLIA